MKKLISALSVLLVVGSVAFACKPKTTPEQGKDKELIVTMGDKPIVKLTTAVGGTFDIVTDPVSATPNNIFVSLKEAQVTSSDPKIVEATKRALKAVGTGTATITISSGDLKKTFEVEVKELKIDPKRFFGFNETGYIYIPKGSYENMSDWATILKVAMPQKGWELEADVPNGIGFLNNSKGGGFALCLYRYSNSQIIAKMPIVSAEGFHKLKKSVLEHLGFKKDYKEGEDAVGTPFALALNDEGKVGQVSLDESNKDKGVFNIQFISYETSKK